MQADTAALGLDDHQKQQAKAAAESGDKTVSIQLENAYSWLLVPSQRSRCCRRARPRRWSRYASRRTTLGASGSVLQRASYRAVTDNHLITGWGPKVLLIEVGRYNLWQGAQQIGVRQLWQYLATYLYLPRLKDRDVLYATIRAGAASTTSSAMR